MTISEEGDCYRCFPPDPGTGTSALGAGEASALGASASVLSGTGETALSGTASASAPLTFTLDSGASRSFFRDRTTLTPLSRPVAVSLADPSGGPVLSRFSTVLPCPAAPSGTLSGLYLPSFSTNLVSGAALQDAGVHQFAPAGQRVTHCTEARTGRHLATFTRTPGSSLYTLTTESPPVPASGRSVFSLGASVAEVPVACVGTCVDTSPGALEDALLSFTQSPLPAPVFVTLADPTSGPVTTRYTSTLPCPAIPLGFLAGFHVPSFSRNLVGMRPLVDNHVGVWIEPFGDTATCVNGDMYAPLATFHAEPGSGLYTLHIGPRERQQQQLPPTPVTAPRQVPTSHQVATSHQVTASGLPRVLPSLPPLLAPPCAPCVEGRLRTPHSSLRSATEPFETLQLDVWGPASRPGPERESFYAVPVVAYHCGHSWSSCFDMDIARTSVIRARAPHFLWPYAVRVFLGFPKDSSGFTFYHPPLHRFFDSHDVRFDESVPYYTRYPCQGLPVPPPPLFPTPTPPPAPQVQPPPLVQPCQPSALPPQATVDPEGAGVRSADPGGATSGGVGVGAESVPPRGSGAGGAGVGAEPESAGGSSLRGAGASCAVPGGATTGGAMTGGAGAPTMGLGESGTGHVTAGGARSGGGATGALESGPGATTALDTTPPPHPYLTRHQARVCRAREEQLELESFATIEDLITHLRTSDTRYRAALKAELLVKNPSPMYITLYFIVTRLHFLALDPTDLIVNLLEKHLLETETSIVAVGAARGTPRTPFFEGCSPFPLAPSYASAAVVDILGTEEFEAASAPSGKRRSGKGKGGKSGGGGSRDGGGSGGDGGGGGGGGAVGVVAGVGASVAVLVAAVGVVVVVVAVVGVVAAVVGVVAAAVMAVGEKLFRGESALPSTVPAEALHTFTLDSGASHCFFRDSTTLTPLPALVPVRLVDPSGALVLARSTTILPCPAVPSGSLSGLHLPSFSTKLVSTAALQDAMVTTTTIGGQRVAICTCARSGYHLATFTRRPGSSLYTLTTEPAQVAASGQVSASCQVAAPCSCRLLSHQTLLWHHHLGHPSLPRLHGMHSRLLVSGLSKSLPPLPPSPAPSCLPCIKGRQHAAPHSSSFPPMTAPLQTLSPLHHGLPLGQQDLPILRLHSNGYGEFSSDLLWDFCRGEGILQPFRLQASPQQNGVAERRIGLVMEVADPLPLVEPFEVTVDSGAARGAASGGAEPAGAEPGGAEPVSVEPGAAEPEGAEPGGAETGGAEPGGAESWGAESGGAEPRGTASAGGPAGASPRQSRRQEPLSPWQLCEWFAQRTRLRSGAAGARGGPAARGTGAGGAGATSPGGAGVTAGAGGPGGAGVGGPGGAGAAGLRGSRTRGTGAAGAGGVGGAGAGDPVAGVAGARGAGAGGTKAGDLGGASDGGAGAGGAGAGGTGAGGGGAGDPGAGGAGVGCAGAGGTGAGGIVQRRPFFIPSPPSSLPPPGSLQLNSPLPAPSPYAEQTDSLTECREPASRPDSPVRAVRTGRRVPRPRPPPIAGTHIMALRPSSVPLRVPLPSPPASSLADGPNPESDLVRASTPTITRLLATVVTDPSFDSTAASALVAELVDLAAACRLDYATSLVAESESDCPLSGRFECALGTDVLKDRQEDFECLAAAVPHLVAVLLAPEGDPDAPDIPTPRSYAEAITGPYSSQWQTAMDAEMASWKSTGIYLDALPPPRANIVDGMWIFKVKQPPGSPHVFKARYVAQDFSQRQGVDFFQTFSPTPKMTTLWVLLHIAAKHDYELHSLDFSTAFLQGSLHEEI
ncbi:unnamed protein product [Closterium sp. NIES-53]